MKAVVAAFNQEKALVGAFSVIANLRMDLFEALQNTQQVNIVRVLNTEHPVPGKQTSGSLTANLNNKQNIRSVNTINIKSRVHHRHHVKRNLCSLPQYFLHYFLVHTEVWRNGEVHS